MRHKEVLRCIEGIVAATNYLPLLWTLLTLLIMLLMLSIQIVVDEAACQLMQHLLHLRDLSTSQRWQEVVHPATLHRLAEEDLHHQLGHTCQQILALPVSSLLIATQDGEVQEEQIAQDDQQQTQRLDREGDTLYTLEVFFGLESQYLRSSCLLAYKDRVM